ncbi:unnamed protein product, partial [Symbiodinium sp. CCMP2592]
ILSASTPLRRHSAGLVVLAAAAGVRRKSCRQRKRSIRPASGMSRLAQAEDAETVQSALERKADAVLEKVNIKACPSVGVKKPPSSTS